MRKIDLNLKFKILGASDKPMNWHEAKEYCEKLGGRLPTANELELLAILQRQKLIETKFTGAFWSSTEYTSTSALNVYFSSGNTYVDAKDYYYGALCLGND